MVRNRNIILNSSVINGQCCLMPDLRGKVCSLIENDVGVGLWKMTLSMLSKVPSTYNLLR